jgi:ParB family chromosome partitioning protein
MKKDSKRREIRDAIDFMTDEVIGIQTSEIAIDLIDEFSEHPFHLYEGKRLEDMVESIRTNGVLNPVIVRNNGERYEMLSGHNRMNASKLAGLETVPALVKEGLSDEEAYVYVLETNLMQRSFNDMYPSEKAIVLQLRYDKIANQGKRTDIERELKALESDEEIPDEEPQIDSRGRIAKEYGLSGRTMARLLRINDLTEEWKRSVDNETVAFLTGVNVSYLALEVQKHLHDECQDLNVKLSLKDAKKLKEMNDDVELDETSVSKFLVSNEKSKLKKKNFRRFKLPIQKADRYFDDSMTQTEIEAIIEKALEQYFEEDGADI